MRELIEKAQEAKNKVIDKSDDKIKKSKFYYILELLDSISSYDIDKLDTEEDNKIFNSFCDFRTSYDSNYNGFSEFCNGSKEDLLLFNVYYLKKSLKDIIESFSANIFTLEEIDQIFSTEFNVIIEIINSIKSYLEMKVQQLSEDSIDNSQIVNYIIFPTDDILNRIKKLSDTNTSWGTKSMSKSMSAINKLVCTRYNDPLFSHKIHKLKYKGDLRLTKFNILAERFSTGKTTKVSFFKLPIESSNLKILREKMNCPQLENIYFITGFGDFKLIGISEENLYKEFLKFSHDSEKNLEYIVNLSKVPFSNDREEEFIKILSKSIEEFKNCNKSSMQSSSKK